MARVLSPFIGLYLLLQLALLPHVLAERARARAARASADSVLVRSRSDSTRARAVPMLHGRRVVVRY